MTIKPMFEFNKYDFGLGIVFRRENESKKYFRKYKIINYIFGVVFLWFLWRRCSLFNFKYIL